MPENHERRSFKGAHRSLAQALKRRKRFLSRLLLLPLLALLLASVTGCGSARPTKPPEALSCNLADYKVSDIFDQWGTYRLRVPPHLRTLGPQPSFNVLSLSAGGEYGAYGAGFLVGWGSVGDAAWPGPRRDIQVVTGVSTGAILATHAFLGRDKEIADLYRTVEGKQIYRFRPLLENIWSNSITNTSGKDELIEKTITSEIIDEVAAQHGAGRFLYIGILDIDSGEFARIDMVKLAHDIMPKENRDRCYRAVIGASSAIPIAFSPVFMDGRMWVDGGTRRHMFIAQPSPAAMEPNVIRRLYSFVHGDLAINYEQVRNGVLYIALRTSEVFTDQGLKDSVRLQEALASKCPPDADCGRTGRLFSTYYAAAAGAAAECNAELGKCGSSGGLAGEDMFCHPYMKCLADAGERDGRDYASNRKWLSADDLHLGFGPEHKRQPLVEPRLFK